MDHRQRRTTSSTTVEDIYTEGDPKMMEGGGRNKGMKKNEQNPRSEQRTRTKQNLGQQTHAHNIIRWVDAVPLVTGPVLSPLLFHRQQHNLASRVSSFRIYLLLVLVLMAVLSIRSLVRLPLKTLGICSLMACLPWPQ